VSVIEGRATARSRTTNPRVPGDVVGPERAGLAPVVALVLVGWLLAWGVAQAFGITSTQPRWATPLRVGSGVFAAVVSGWAGWLALRRSPLVAGVIVAGTSVSLVGLATIALHGTRWSFNALYSDAGFRTEAVTRFADSPALADYGYKGLPSYYPPALPWLQGRFADLLGVPAWAMMKPAMLVLAATVPVLAFLLWRRVVPDLSAALVVLATTVATADLVKPDEWLVLALVLPWWLELTRDIRAGDRQPRRWWTHGLVLGVLLLWHSYYFVPLGVATVLGMVVDRLRRRPAPLPPRRAVSVAAVGLVVAAPYWAPMVWLRLEGEPADHLQMRWSRPGWEWPPWPLPLDLVGALGLVGVVWLVWRARSTPLAEALAVALVGAYAFFLGGEWLQRWDVAVLPEKTEDLIRALLVTSGVLALTEALSEGSRLLPTGRLRRLVAAVTVGVLAVLAVVGLSGRPLSTRGTRTGPIRRADRHRRRRSGTPGGSPPGTPRWPRSPAPGGRCPGDRGTPTPSWSRPGRTCWRRHRCTRSSPGRASTPIPTGGSPNGWPCCGGSAGVPTPPAPRGCCGTTASTASTVWCWPPARAGWGSR
jgi:galactan 5-O-arabinofuranosyltransferase